MKTLLENWRGYMTEAKDSEKVSKAVIIKEDGALLLLRSKGEKFPGKWDLPGGHIHVGEDPKDGLVREVKEDTGVPLQKPIEKLYVEDNMTYSRAHMPTQAIQLSPHNAEQELQTKDTTHENNDANINKANKNTP